MSAVVVLSLALAVQAQATQTSLPPPVATLAHEFSQITTLRELSDGRVIVGDRREATLVVADFKVGSVVTIGGVGNGPQEYPSIQPVLAMRGDSSLMVDAGARRWLLLSGARVVGTLSPSDPAYAVAKGRVIGADERGYLLTTVPIFVEKPGGLTSDSLVAILVHSATGTADTVARLRGPPAQIRTTTDGGMVTSFTRTAPVLATSEAVLLHSDGWLSVARIEPYRVDWRAPSGRWVNGAPLPFREIAMDDREREAFIARQSAALGRPSVLPPQHPWAKTIPPFEYSPLFAAPDGNVIIARTPSAREPGNRYDVVDRQGNLLTQISMPESVRIVGFGRRSVYTVLVDDDGIETLRRHPWPFGPRHFPVVPL